MDNTLIIIVLVIAILAIVALPRLGRSKQQDPIEPAATHATPAANPATAEAPALATAAQIDAQPLSRWLCDQACAQTGIDLRQDRMALTRISEAAAKMRAEIDKAGKAEISLPYIAADARGPKHFSLKITREQVAALPQRMV
jgi:Tfp pilus assembly protein FimT